MRNMQLSNKIFTCNLSVTYHLHYKIKCLLILKFRKLQIEKLNKSCVLKFALIICIFNHMYLQEVEQWIKLLLPN